MMSEHQPRKCNVSSDPQQQPSKNNFTKRSGNVASQKTPARFKSKNTLPKNLRYDLENALVGLCDVWFEEIKPYLERNNIKLHVHEPTAGNGQGDSARCAPGAAPDCAHLHPASSAPRCELCRLLFNAANSIESAVSQAACVSPNCAASPDQTRNTGQCRSINHQLGRFKSQRHKSNEDTRLKADKRKTRKRKPKAFQSKHLVPRLCQTYSLPAGTYRQQKMVPIKVAPAINQKPPLWNNKNIGRTKNKPELKDASTQTDTLLMIKTVNPTPRKSFRSGCHFGRCPATTALLPPKNKNNSIKDPKNIKILDTEVPPLFKNDLIDIIGEKHDTMLRVIYKSPERSDASRYSSSLDLFSPYKLGKKSANCKKTRPWR